MSNGTNNWDVSFGDISWFENLLKTHDNVATVRRRDDIVFDVTRNRQRDDLSVLCLREYTMSLTLVHRAVQEFGHLDIIYIGGGWCSFTADAKSHCLSHKIGLYTTPDMTGALFSNDYWAYERRNSPGAPSVRSRRR